jgi:hypothetical protein
MSVTRTRLDGSCRSVSLAKVRKLRCGKPLGSHAVRLFAAALAIALFVAPARADSRVFDSLQISSEGDGTVITARFNIPVTYLNHAPTTSGSTLQINLRPMHDQTSGDAAASPEHANVKVSDGVSVRDAVYEETGSSSAKLTFSFSRPVNYRVAAGADGRSVVVTVLDAGTSAAPAPAAKTVIEAPPPSPMTAKDVPQSALPAGEIATLMESARQAMAKGDYPGAIRILTKILESVGNAEAKPEALEMLGLARERNHQLAHAKAEYEEYLRLYPSGEGADRVRQRLAGLLAATAKPKARLRQPESVLAGESGGEFSMRGSFSQSLRRDEDIFANDEEGVVRRFDLDSDLDANATYRDGNVEINLRANGGYTNDFLDNTTTDKQGRFSAGYLDIATPGRSVALRVGRQTRSTDGILGRFDGAVFSFKPMDELRVNFSGGLPVDLSTDLFLNKERYFAGSSVDIGPMWNDLSANVYFIEQWTADQVVDRQAVGGELRYTSSGMTAFGLFDYDLSYNAVNIATLSGNYFFDDQSTFNVAVDYRTSPILTTTNALQGQPVTTMEELLAMFPEDQVRQLAEDRTANIKSVTVGASHPFDDMFQISGDAMVTDISGTVTSGGIEGTPRTGYEYYYSMQLTGSNMVTDNDIATLAFRYADQDLYNRGTVDLNTRYPLTDKLRINPRIRFDYRWDDHDSGTQTSARPSLRLNFNDHWWEIELEAGGEWRKNESPLGVTDESLGYFAYFTYRLDY